MAKVFEPSQSTERGYFTKQSITKPALITSTNTTPHQQTSNRLFASTVQEQGGEQHTSQGQIDCISLYRDKEKNQRYLEAKAASDWDTAWHALVARPGWRTAYDVIRRYCPEAQEKYTGNDETSMPRRCLDYAAANAAIAGDLEALKWLVGVDADLAAFHLLTTSAYYGHNHVVEYLLDPKQGVGLNPDRRYRYEKSDMQKRRGVQDYVFAAASAANGGHVETVKLIVRCGGHLSMKDEQGDNILHCLLLKKNLEGLNVIIDCYDKSDLPNEKLEFAAIGKTNKTPLALAYHRLRIAHEGIYKKMVRQPGIPTGDVLRSDHRDKINEAVRPWIAICKKIQTLSGLSPFDGGFNQRRNIPGIVPMATYATLPENYRNNFIMDLYHADEVFANNLWHQASRHSSDVARTVDAAFTQGLTLGQRLSPT